MSEEAAGFIFVHASSAGVIVILFPGYAADFMVSRLRMQDYKAAYAGLWYHGVTLRHLDAKESQIVKSAFYLFYGIASADQMGHNIYIIS